MKIAIEIPFIPLMCGNCKFYSEVPYTCHNERGTQAKCALGYMDNEDMRERSYDHRLFEGCKLKDNRI